MTTVHLLGLPHTETTKAWSTCAFTQKVITAAAMLTMAGHEAIVYSGEQNDAPCAEHVTVATAEDRRRWFGAERWEDRVFDQWDINAPCWVELNANIAKAIQDRAGSRDVISLTMGPAHQAVAGALPGLLAVELGVGYESIIPDGFHVFESYAWMHHSYGRHGINDVRFYDTVIPNAFDPTDFTYRDTKDDYLLFLGRLTPRKGLAVIEEIAKHHRVVTAGQGDVRVPGAEHVGVVRGVDRAELLAGARALLAPTVYVEPFGGVAVEAMLSGTPVISTDVGAFTETIRHGVTGYRCSTLREFHTAVDKANDLDASKIRAHALERYSLDAVAPQYDAYLARLDTLHGDGWYAP